MAGGQAPGRTRPLLPPGFGCVAKHLDDTGVEAMQERGRMQEGMVADIVVLDP